MLWSSLKKKKVNIYPPLHYIFRVHFPFSQQFLHLSRLTNKTFQEWIQSFILLLISKSTAHENQLFALHQSLSINSHLPNFHYLQNLPLALHKFNNQTLVVSQPHSLTSSLCSLHFIPAQATSLPLIMTPSLVSIISPATCMFHPPSTLLHHLLYFILQY